MTGKPSLEHAAASCRHGPSPTPKYCHCCKTHPRSQHLHLWHFAIHGHQRLLSSELPGRSWVATDETAEVGRAFHPEEEWQGSQLLWKRRLHWPETSSKASPLVGPCNRFTSVWWRQMLQQMEASDRILGTGAQNGEVPGVSELPGLCSPKTTSSSWLHHGFPAGRPRGTLSASTASTFESWAKVCILKLVSSHR